MGQNLEVSWAEAKKEDTLNSRFFNPESNMKYRMTFVKKEVEDKDSPDGKCITGRLIRAQVPVWKDGKKTDKNEEKVILQLVIDNFEMTGIDGEFGGIKPCEKLWRIKNVKMRNLFRTYVENDLLDKKVFVIEINKELMGQDYSVAVLDRTEKK